MQIFNTFIYITLYNIKYSVLNSFSQIAVDIDYFDLWHFDVNWQALNMLNGPFPIQDKQWEIHVHSTLQLMTFACFELQYAVVHINGGMIHAGE